MKPTNIKQKEERMKIVKALIIVCLFSFILFPQIVFAIGLEAALGVWNQDPQGDIAYKGQTLSIEDELKYGDETKVFGRVKIDMPLNYSKYLSNGNANEI